MSSLIRRQIPIAIVAMLSTILILEYFTTIESIDSMGKLSAEWAVVIGSFVMGLGSVGLVRRHGKIVMSMNKTDSPYSLLLLVFFFATTIMGFSLFGIGGPVLNNAYKSMYNDIFMVMSTVTWGLAGFFMVSGAYRAFVARNKQGLVLVVAGLFTLIGLVPIGAAIWPPFVAIQEWIKNVPGSAASAGISLGAALGGLSFALRLILGIERTWLRGSE